VTRSLAYENYLHSAEWITLRTRIVEKRGAWCEQCGSTGRIELHHLTYERLGHELESDVRLLCFDCHRAAHTFNATAHAQQVRRRGQRHSHAPPGVDLRKKKRRSRNL
jgi:hypothetical protein